MIIHSTTLDTKEKVIAIYGGTAWARIEGRFLLGASNIYAADSIGGEATHTLTVAEMPSHTHPSKVDVTFHPAPGGSNEQAWAVNASSRNYNGCGQPVGGNGAHNNMPPYRAVYIWERTA